MKYKLLTLIMKEWSLCVIQYQIRVLQKLQLTCLTCRCYLVVHQLSKFQMKKAGGVDQKLDLKSVVEGGSNASARNSSSSGTKSKMGKSVALSLQDIKKATHGLNLVSIESGLMSQLGQAATSGIVHGRPYFVSSTSMKTASSTHIAKPRTWH
ncbi:hypothetical protein C1H46_007549 [Malus baccata]|uniref:Uncharacterized protein n=1 Tax=Malus baccata TaxID=106549 RepID=A0A540N708_MALBA|nr:hypothetical protein C1H46_007549 [Malus baccata]